MSRKSAISHGGGFSGAAAHPGIFNNCLTRLSFILLIGWYSPTILTTVSAGQEISPADSTDRSASILPILMYDSDIGFGSGVKTVLKNYLGRRESADILIFLSTKGEQNYVLGFSFPDQEIRQGKLYPIALDIKFEYDKLLKSNFFGVGNSSEDNDYQFPREKTELQITAGRAVTGRWLTGAGVRLTHYSLYNFSPDWQTINDETPGAGETEYMTFISSLRYDTRNSVLNPTVGLKLELILEPVITSFGNGWNFTRIRLEYNQYHLIFKSGHVLAYRLWIQHINGNAPYQELSKIGDSWTARGYKAERFLDRSMTLASVEYRFPLYRLLGGVLFVDSGRVWPGLDKISPAGWHSNIGAGLRLYLENFVTRLDIGRSEEGTRLFLNFGHVF